MPSLSDKPCQYHGVLEEPEYQYQSEDRIRDYNYETERRVILPHAFLLLGSNQMMQRILDQQYRPEPAH